jgi:hypothetical protein
MQGAQFEQVGLPILTTYLFPKDDHAEDYNKQNWETLPLGS